MFVLATIGAAALYLLFIWLVSAAASAWLADRKGYGERVGLFFGLILSAVGFLIVLLLPGRPGSRWKVEGPLPNPGAHRPLGLTGLGPAAATAEMPDALGPALEVPDAPPASGAESSPPSSAEEPQRGDEPQGSDDGPAAG
jgi:hypothetical protein